MMLNKTYRSRLALAATLLITFSANAQVTKDQVLKALKEGAGYLSHTVLDASGKSRCDYNLTEGKWYDYEIPWHTGQAIYALVEAYKITNDTGYLAAAKRGGDYWISMEVKDGSGMDGMVKATHGDVIGQEDIVFATVSDGTPGIYALSKITNNPGYARVATSAAGWLLKNMYYAKEGVCYDLANATTGEVLKENSPFWAGKPKEDQDLFDVSRPNTEGSLFKDAYEFSGDKKFKKAFVNLCNSLVDKQGPEGLWMQFMPNFQEEGSFHPRFNLWYAESLLEAYDLTKDKRYVEAAARTADAYAKAQQEDGTIYYKNFINGKPPEEGSVCGSAVAFAGILWMRLDKLGHHEFRDHIEKAATWLLRNHFSMNHPDPNLRGATLNTRMRHKKGKIWLVNRDIGTSFAVRFFADYMHYKF